MGIIRERGWIKYLPDEFTLYFSENVARSGRLILGGLDKGDQCVARYDTAHGFGHGDIMAE